MGTGVFRARLNRRPRGCRPRRQGLRHRAGCRSHSRTQRMPPAYGLDGEYELIASSTAAMLTELKSASEKQEDIAVINARNA
ncbi:glycine betaine ABC transporter substrate-binding protein [Micromonospora sp. U21]|uniref:glycine betaine ABC transporter substrate-binding protein n=1 Tax=Micromonospora sp. U21 TaxID=2824899 RepID=UPI0035A938D9